MPGGEDRGAVLPPGFELVQARDTTTAILRADLVPVLRDLSPATLERLTARRDQEFAAEREGRGGVGRLALDGGHVLRVKKYRRGGALAAVLPDLFPTRSRMLADLRACERARERGVAAAQVAGLILRKRAGFLWAGYLLTEEIPGAVSLSRALGTDDPDAVDGAAGRAGTEDPHGSGAPALARRGVALVRRMHDAGILHRDLNLGNLLAGRDGIHVIDLDGASLHPSLSAAQRFRNLSRLDRSYVKLFGGRGPLSHEDRRGLLAEYCGEDASMLRDFESRLPGHKRSLFRHGLLRRR